MGVGIMRDTQNTLSRSKRVKSRRGSTFRIILSHREKSMTSHLFSKLALAAAATLLLMTPVCASAGTQAETLVKKIYQQAFKDKNLPSFDNYVQKYGTKEFAKIWQCGSNASSGEILFDTDPLFFWTQDPEIKPKAFEIKGLAGNSLVTVSVKMGDDSDSAVYVMSCDEGKCKISDFIYSFGSAKYTIIEAYPKCMPKN